MSKGLSEPEGKKVNDIKNTSASHQCYSRHRAPSDDGDDDDDGGSGGGGDEECCICVSGSLLACRLSCLSDY